MPSYTEAARELALLNPDQFHNERSRAPYTLPESGDFAHVTGSFG